MSGRFGLLATDASDVRIVHNKLLGGWYVVRGPHQTPLNGRFNSKEEAQAWLDRRKGQDSKLATDPPVSEPQRRAMFAAKEGRSTLGIPKSVGEKFVGKGRDAAFKTAADIQYSDYDSWSKAVFAKYQDAKFKDEKIAGAFGGRKKIAYSGGYSGNNVVGVYTFSNTKNNPGGYVS